MRLPIPALLLVLFLSGCALPPAVSVASFVADGASYVITGKSTTDHAISMVVQQDCALLRVVRGRPICDPDDEVLIELVGFDSAEENSADEGDFDLQDNGTTTFREPAREVAIVKSPRQQSVKLNRVTEINASNTSYGKKVGDLISTMGISDG